jgi:hypothetical protein
MSSVAVQLIQPDGDSFSGILVADPKVGQDVRVYIGQDKIYRIFKVRGWIRLCGSNSCILFDYYGKRFRLRMLASSDQFL